MTKMVTNYSILEMTSSGPVLTQNIRHTFLSNWSMKKQDEKFPPDHFNMT